MLGFHAISDAPFSAQALTQHNASASLSGSATFTLPKRMFVSATISADSVMTHAVKAVLSSDSPFSRGFTQGFQVGTLLTGDASVHQHGFPAVIELSANGTVERLASTLLETSAIFKPHVTVLEATLQSIGSLAGKGVLLHSGSVDINTLTTIVYDPQIPDIVPFAAYIHRTSLIDGNIDKGLDLIGYIDKQLIIDPQIDLSCGISAYIDKVVEKTLIRER